MENNILQHLQANYYRLKGVELKLATLILQDPKAFTTYSMAEVSALAGISQGSIVNVSKAFADGGFPALKLSVASALSTYSPKPFSRIDKNDDLNEIFQKRTDDLCAAFKHTQQLNSIDVLNKVADLILNARKVELYGIYRSTVAATSMYYNLLELGIPAVFVNDTLSCAVSASMLEKEDLVIAISSSGQTKEIVDTVKIARRQGVPVIALTAHPDSALSKLADITLIAAQSGNSLGENGTEILLADMLLMDSICTYLSLKTKAESGPRYLQMKEILSSHSVD